MKLGCKKTIDVMIMQTKVLRQKYVEIKKF